MRAERIPLELWDALYFLSVTTLLTGLLLRDLLPWPVGALALTMVVVFRAFARAVGGVSNWAYQGFRLIFFGLLLVPLLIRGIPLQDLVSVIFAVFLSGLEGIIANILKMSATDNLPLWLGFLSVIVLLLLSYIGLEVGSVLLYRLIYWLLAPLFTLALMLAQWSQGGWQGMALVGGSVFSLFLFVESAYLILRYRLQRP